MLNILLTPLLPPIYLSSLSLLNLSMFVLFLWRWWAFWVIGCKCKCFASMISFFCLSSLTAVSSPFPSTLSFPLFVSFRVTDSSDSDLELSMVRHQPEGLEQLQAQTQFTRKELQSLYRGFKNVRKHSAYLEAIHQFYSLLFGSILAQRSTFP